MESDQQLSPNQILTFNKNIFLTFPNLLTCLQKSSFYIKLSEKNILYKENSEYLKEIRAIFESFECILETNIIQWKFLQNQERGYFCEHTFMTMVVLWNNPEFIELDQNSKQILLWTMLFHDVCKRGSPLLTCRDPFHPYSSACKALEIFLQHGLVEKKSGIEDFFEFLMNSFLVKWNNIQVMDLTKLEEIFQGLLYFTGINDEIVGDFESYSEIERTETEEKRFLFEILVLILLHQSLEFNNMFMNMSNLNFNQVKRYLSKRMVKLLHIVYLADHNSYNVGRDLMNEFSNDGQIMENAKRYLAIFYT